MDCSGGFGVVISLHARDTLILRHQISSITSSQVIFEFTNMHYIHLFPKQSHIRVLQINRHHLQGPCISTYPIFALPEVDIPSILHLQED